MEYSPLWRSWNRHSWGYIALNIRWVLQGSRWHDTTRFVIFGFSSLAWRILHCQKVAARVGVRSGHGLPGCKVVEYRLEEGQIHQHYSTRQRYAWPRLVIVASWIRCPVFDHAAPQLLKVTTQGMARQGWSDVGQVPLCGALETRKRCRSTGPNHFPGVVFNLRSPRATMPRLHLR